MMFNLGIHCFNILDESESVEKHSASILTFIPMEEMFLYATLSLQNLKYYFEIWLLIQICELNIKPQS